MREIVLDTETTGIDPKSGHRLVEIGCLELDNHIPTNRTYHVYLNPERDVPAEAYEVHGLDSTFLSDKPRFSDIVDSFLNFIDNASLVIHNASFDMGFINAELTRIGYDPLPSDRAIDTLAMAREQFPGAQASLDALCRRFGVDNANRTVHGALLDSQLLADVYLELCGGRQPDLELGADQATPGTGMPAIGDGRAPQPPRAHAPTAEEAAAHARFLERLKEPLWWA